MLSLITKLEEIIFFNQVPTIQLFRDTFQQKRSPRVPKHCVCIMYLNEGCLYTLGMTFSF